MAAHRLPALVILVAFLVGRWAALGQSPWAVEYADTPTYLDCSDRVLQGSLPFDEYRTPVYPVFLAIVQACAGHRNLEAVVVAQMALAALGLMGLYRLAWWLLRSRFWATAVTAGAASNLYLVQWDQLILTEGLSLVLTVWTTLACLGYLTRNRPGAAWHLGLSLAALWCWRPMYLYLPALVVAVVGRRRPGPILVPSVLALVCLVSYNWAYFGYLGLSRVAPMNLFGRVERARLYEPPPERRLARLSEDLGKYLLRNPEPSPWEFRTAHPEHSPDMEAFARAAVRAGPGKWFRSCAWDALGTWLRPPYLGNFRGPQISPPWNRFCRFTLWLATFLVPAWLILSFLDLRRQPDCCRLRLSLLLFAIWTANCLAAGFLSYSEFYRLRSPWDWVALVGVAWAARQARTNPDPVRTLS